MKSQLFKLLTAIALMVGFVLFVYTNTQKKPAAIIPLTYNTTKSLQDFNFTDIEKYPTSAGTYDLQTMATNITSQMLNIFSNSSEKALPLVGNWNVGIPEDSDGLDPMYMINRLTYGEHVIPAWDLDPYYSNGISLSYYEESIKKAAELNLPLVFICPSFASALTNDSVYFNMNTTVNPNVITADRTVLAKLSPFGDNDIWNEVGNQWSTTSLMQQIQEWYPNPPLVLFIEKNRAPKLLWSELSLSKRYNTVYGIDKSDEFKKTLVNAQWLEKYRQLHEGFKEGLTQKSWKNNVRFLTKDQLAINMGTATNWMDFTTTTSQYMNLWPLTADGLNVDVNFSSDTSYNTINNLPPMFGEAKAQNSDFVSQLGLDDINTSEDLERYRGYVQFALWFTRPGLVRHKSNQTNKDDIYILYQQVVDSVDLIYNDEVLSDFWKYGKLFSTGSSNLNLNIPIAFQNIPREFLLDTDSNEIVWSFALEKGETPNREWLIYIQSPEKNVTNVTVNFSPYGNITLDASQQGSFYTLYESTQNLNKVNNSDNNIIIDTNNIIEENSTKQITTESKKQRVLKWLYGLHNKSKNKVLSGQYFMTSHNEVEKIYNLTKKYPALVETYLWQTNWGSGKGHNAGDGGRYWPNAITHREMLANYWKKGSLISIHMPIPNPKNMSSQKDLDLTLNEYIDAYTDNGNIINKNLKVWLDTFAKHIKWIKDSTSDDIPIIIRPLHERGKFFWWGGVKESPDSSTIIEVPNKNFIALFRYIVNYLKITHSLKDNLIITFAMHGEHIDTSYYPGDSFVDLIGLDIYTDEPLNKYYGSQLDSLAIKYNKPVYVSELGWNWRDNLVGSERDAYKTIISDMSKNTKYTCGWLSWANANNPAAQKNTIELYQDPNVITRDEIDW